MKKRIYLIISLLLMITHLLSARERKLFISDWLFMKDDSVEFSMNNYNDSHWRKLDLPHDWAIEGPFHESHDTRTGGLPVDGVAWYRKNLCLSTNDKDKLILLEFDGIMSNATIYVNGKEIYYRPNGYIGYQLDITPYISLIENNIIAIRVAPEALASRWYSGAGIYRNVWLEKKNKSYIKHWGTRLTTPEVSRKEALVAIEVSLKLASHAPNKELIITINDSEGHKIQSKEIILDSKENLVSVKKDFVVKKPNLWSPDTPNLYEVVYQLKQSDQILDCFKEKLGIRSIRFNASKGFILNGEVVKLKGVCLHHDLGPLGSAINRRAMERQLIMLKTMGANAIRTSHNPPAPEQLDLCDSLGLFVQVEAFDGWKLPKVKNGYHKYWDEWHEKDLRDLIRRDRNHPSIIMWSIGNEMREQGSKIGAKIAKRLTDICHEEDTTRPTTAGFNNYKGAVENKLVEAVDIVGLNYKPTLYGDFLERFPNAIVYGSETSSCVSSRGVYHLPIENYERHESLQLTSYDIISPPWAYPPDFEIYAQEMEERSLGEFVWTGFDYLGEPTPFNGLDNHTNGKWGGDWPSRSSYFGIIDLCGIPKDRYYFYQSRWTDVPMVHILPHWNWKKGELIPIYCYTNCDEVELFINGRSLGRKQMGIDKTTIPADFQVWKEKEKIWNSPYRLTWNVPFEEGEIKAVAYKNDKILIEKKINTAKQAYSIDLEVDRTEIIADGKDLAFITVSVKDEYGHVVPMAENLIEFDIKGYGKIIATGNGDPTQIRSFQLPNRPLFNGKAVVIVQSIEDEVGLIQLIARSRNLKTAKITIKAK